MEVRFAGHTSYKTEYHIVWIPKYRRRILNPGVKSYLTKIFPGLLRSLPGVEVVEQNIQVDHVHTVMIIPPKYAVADVVAELKARSASLLRAKFAWLAKVYWKENIVWSPGYFVSTVGLNEAQIIRYVQLQDHQDSGQMKFVLE
jgi:putative transposase